MSDPRPIGELVAVAGHDLDLGGETLAEFAIPAVSLWQPWASAIHPAAKTYETRGYATKTRGWIAIAATKTTPRDAGWPRGLDRTGQDRVTWNGVDIGPWPLPTGAVVAVAFLAGVFPIRADRDFPAGGSACVCADGRTIRLWRRGEHPAPLYRVGDWYTLPHGRAEADLGDYTPGRYAWALDRIIRLEPRPCVGSQGIWRWPVPADLRTLLR